MGMLDLLRIWMLSMQMSENELLPDCVNGSILMALMVIRIVKIRNPASAETVHCF